MMPLIYPHTWDNDTATQDPILNSDHQRAVLTCIVLSLGQSAPCSSEWHHGEQSAGTEAARSPLRASMYR
eukprot:scaffold273029_cov17-Tisochrysis_lutea.AAC.3